MRNNSLSIILNSCSLPLDAYCTNSVISSDVRRLCKKGQIHSGYFALTLHNTSHHDHEYAILEFNMQILFFYILKNYLYIFFFLHVEFSSLIIAIGKIFSQSRSSFLIRKIRQIVLLRQCVQSKFKKYMYPDN